MSQYRFINALLKQPIDRTPCWMMRQAGRYLPEYMALRHEVPDFMTFCKTPELAAEVTLQPLRRFPLDAAIIFSDILTLPDAMGLDLKFVKGEGPVIHDPIRGFEDLKRLRDVDVHDALGYVKQAIELTCQQLPKETPLIGFCGSPWTVATYMVEGGSSKVFKHIKTLMYREPDTMHALLNQLADISIAYLNMQIEAGAKAVQIFDTWGGVLSTPYYQAFSLAYMQKIVDGLIREVAGEKIPVIFFTKGAGRWLPLLAETSCDAVGLDWTIDLQQAKNEIGAKKALQGNLDPFLLFSTPAKVKEATKKLLDVYQGDTGYVFNLGHGIDKDTPIENVEAMLNVVAAS